MIRLDPQGVYTAKEVAKMLGRSLETVRKWARRLNKPKPSQFFSAEEVRQILRVS